MRGIAGFLDFSRATAAQTPRRIVGDMASSLHHRGPDYGDVWIEAEAGVALGHRRLSIVDLSPAGRQALKLKVQIAPESPGTKRINIKDRWYDRWFSVQRSS